MNNNKRNNKKDILKTRGFYISLMAGSICLVALAAVYMGTYGEFGNSGRQLDINDASDYAEYNEGMVNENLEDIDMAELQEKEDGEQPVNTKQPAETQADSSGIHDAQEEGTQEDGVQEDSMPEDEYTNNDMTEKKTEKNNDKTNNKTGDGKPEDEESVGVAVMKTGDGVKNLSFNQEKGIMWPVEGNIIMKYSNKATVYHKTLEGYRTNPALIIGAAEGASVCSGADSVVTRIGENEEIGKYVETAIGDDYSVIYGQLDNIQVEKGAELKEGQIIGTIAAPTKYYVEEGSNLYLKMTCGDETVDPLIFLR